MLAQDAVLDDDVVIGLEEPGLPIIFKDDPLAVIRQQFAQTRVARDLGPAPAVDDRRVAGGDPARRADRRAGVDLAAVGPDDWMNNPASLWIEAEVSPSPAA